MGVNQCWRRKASSRVIMLAATLVMGTAASQAQQQPASSGRAIGGGIGLGSAAMSVGGMRSPVLAANIVARVGIDAHNRLLFIAEVNPAQVDNPVMDESFSAVNLLLGYGFGRSFKVRPVLGFQFRSWSGSERVTDSDATPLIGLDAGPELRLSPKLSLSPEVVLRYSLIEPESSVGSRFIGVQLVVSWRPGGR